LPFLDFDTDRDFDLDGGMSKFELRLDAVRGLTTGRFFTMMAGSKAWSVPCRTVA
jgi:hypothetical protein